MAIFTTKTHPLLIPLKGRQVTEDSTVLQKREKQRPCAVCHRLTAYGFKLPGVFRYVCSDQCNRDFFASGSVARDNVDCSINPKKMARSGGWKKGVPYA